ncbi:MAG: ATPase [Candidatus Aenigmarchaeota archaeon]|nr:ATPase [Candidatus Aenigmarchaeota archaeon]
MSDSVHLKIRDQPRKKLHEELHETLEKNHAKMAHITHEARTLLKSHRGHMHGHIAISQHGKTKPMYDVVRVPTGVPGFDKLIEGGIPEKSVILLTGPCGSGKSIFSMRFLVEGGLRGEPGVYVSLKESVEESMNQMRFFGWPIDRLVDEGNIAIVQPELYNFDALLTAIEDAIERIGAKRLVVDTVSIIGMYFEAPFKIRKALLDLGYLLKKLGCTTIAVSEVGESQRDLSPYGVEEFVADGVIILYVMKVNQGSRFLRAIALRKMRSTNHSIDIHQLEITRPGGIVVYPSEEIFTDAASR